MDRRDFLKTATYAGGMLLAPSLLKNIAEASSTTAHIAFVKTTDRVAGINRAIDLLGMKAFQGKDFFIKPNFNSPDATPGSTHADTVVTLVRKLKARGAPPLTIGDPTRISHPSQLITPTGVAGLATQIPH